MYSKCISEGVGMRGGEHRDSLIQTLARNEQSHLIPFLTYIGPYYQV